MSILMDDNLAPERFIFWSPPAGAKVPTGAESQLVNLPGVPLPINRDSWSADPPSASAIGQGVYDYLRQFPDCSDNTTYAELLRDAYPHFLADLAAHAVMLDAKQVEPAYVLRKLTCLKILRLLDPCNRDLLWQLSRGYFELALEFVELSRCRQHFLESMRFGQELLCCDPNDFQAKAILAEIDLFFGDYPAATSKMKSLATQVVEVTLADKIASRITLLSNREPPIDTLVDELEMVAEAMQLHACGRSIQAVAILDRIEEQGQLPELYPSADFYCMVGLARLGAGEQAGAFAALHKALTLEPDHPKALETLQSL